MKLDDPLTTLKGVGPELAKKFARVGITSILELIDYYPRRYDDFSVLQQIGNLSPGDVTIKAKVHQVAGRYVRRGMHVTEAVASDDSGSVRLVWFNQPYRQQAIKPGQEYFISGSFAFKRQRFSITSPSMELVSDFPINTARIIPVYREVKGLTSRQIRAAISQVVPAIRNIQETLPQWVVREFELISKSQAIEMIHFPSTSELFAAARYRLGFEEVFELVLASLLTKAEIQTEKAPIVPFDSAIAKDFVNHLSFTLTNGQRKSIWQIYQDMSHGRPMNRLVEGDVGSGKTLVAAMAAIMVMKQEHQVAFMAPTEILARQHAESLTRQLQAVGLASQVGLLVGSMKQAQKVSARRRIADGTMKLIVGTHALIQESVDMSRLELIIIDEQHRFGVEQRKTLMAKAGHMPHVLSMTATPIPRSLALTLFGELDISILAEKPMGRKPIITKICSPNSRDTVYQAIRQQLSNGRQMFAVCPLIADSATLDVRSAEKLYEDFSTKNFKEFRVGLLHGKMKPELKNEVMQKFVAHELDILVSTTVIEVGVDVPNASIMLIESADRFGLAQVHQLRGRVGRGGHQGYCFLMTSDSSTPSQRLRALEQSDDGFKLAELDLEIRGPGAIYGVSQHGALDLRLAKLTDVELLNEARRAAEMFMQNGESLVKYNELRKRVARLQAVNNLN